MTYDAWGERGYTTTYVHPDEFTDIRARNTKSSVTVDIGSVSIVVDRDTLDRLHEAITVAYELLDAKSQVNA